MLINSKLFHKIDKEKQYFYQEKKRIVRLKDELGAMSSRYNKFLELYFEALNQALNVTDHIKGFAELAIVFGEVINRTEPYPVVEIGTKLGGSAIMFLRALAFQADPRWFLTIDPYANIEFWNDGEDKSQPGHNEGMSSYRRAMRLLAMAAEETGSNWIHFLCTDEEWFTKTFKYIKLPTPKGDRSSISTFSFVYLDGPHNTETVLQQLSFFRSRMCKGGIITIDDSHLFSNLDILINAAYPQNGVSNKGERLYLEY